MVLHTSSKLSIYLRAFFDSSLRNGLRLLLVTGLALLSYNRGSDFTKAAADPDTQSTTDQIISPIPFDEMNERDVYNASGVVPIGDSRFLFCDNKSGDALYELDLKRDGRKKGRLIRHRLRGAAPEAMSDLEDMTLAEGQGRRFVFATSSLHLHKSKTEPSSRGASDGLLRVTIGRADELTAENITGFRDWFIRQIPALASAAALTPDEGGLNIEGIAWDHRRQALLFGLRGPVPEGKPLVIPVRVKELNGRWATDNLEMLPPIRLSLNAPGGEQGVRGLEYVESLGSFVVIIGRSISGSKVPFSLYRWDGRQTGTMRRLKVSFADKMKPEDVCEGKVDGRPMLMFVDDGGGYQVLWLDKVRL